MCKVVRVCKKKIYTITAIIGLKNENNNKKNSTIKGLKNTKINGQLFSKKMDCTYKKLENDNLLKIFQKSITVIA